MSAQENKEIVRHVLKELFENQNLGVVDGKITEEWTESDMLGLLKQLGAMEAPGARG